MQRSYDVVVIGGGVMGLMVATHLRLLGAGSIALLEQRLRAPAGGKSGAVLRQHYSHVQTIRMARTSLAEFASFEREPGATSASGVPACCSGADGGAPGAPSECPLATARRRPESSCSTRRCTSSSRAAATTMSHRGVGTGSGFRQTQCAPSARFGAEATRLGVDIQLGCEVRGIVVEPDASGRRVGGVETSAGRIATRQVVAATGPWSLRLLTTLGIDVPLEVVRPKQAFLRPPTDFGDEHPIIADLPHEVYYKPESSGTRVGMIAYDQDERVDPDNYDEGVDAAFLLDARERVQRRLPAYARAVIWGGGSGLYTITPDGQAVIGAVAGLKASSS